MYIGGSSVWVAIEGPNYGGSSMGISFPAHRIINASSWCGNATISSGHVPSNRIGSAKRTCKYCGVGYDNPDPKQTHCYAGCGAALP